MIGLLMMFIFVWNLNQEDGMFARRAEILKAHSCHAALVKLKREIPANWTIICNANNMEVTIKKNIEKSSLAEGVDLKEVLYREMANDLMHLAKKAPNDNLERTDYIVVKILNPKLDIHALTEGRYLARLATLTEPRIMAEHLRATVQVQERPH